MRYEKVFGSAYSLKFQAVDDGTRRSLGSLNIPLTTLLKEPKLEQNQQMHMLTLGVHQSPIVITTRIRVIFKENIFDFLCKTILTLSSKESVRFGGAKTALLFRQTR